ncbi:MULTISPECIES: hypothetical protein [Agrobacterium tumefaciens complex]|uniref:DUF945 domain-containing protein n=1 Tax=Agrobacterium radiobacter TaxID=362 RepID=A0ABD5LKL5_AGRRD|nr:MULTISPECIES: hypothetical protein [Agrobacterium tumefaciens complex]TGE78332.1 hypothetical protein C9410_16340 [Rhizobium sp. SEMIA 439]KAB0458231.1 hypothetical protein F7R04_20445 [Agrobacterium tumefaciens]KWT76482.1 hypothetical protein ASH09_13700 [Agrobacterium radiobacter]MBB4283573.1 hypothetical protein [Agrobacterium radiobacter]MBB4321144.1 hypothetical protein [Agrobacterium radiobacter]
MEQENIQTGKGRRRALWAAVAIIAVAAAGVIGGKTFYEAKVKELVARSGATATSIEVDFLGKIHVRDLTLPLEDGKNIKIAAIDGRPKLPFLDGALDMTTIDIDVPTGKISMAQARVENAAFEKPGQAEENGNSLPRRIERFAAARISTPEVTFTQSVATTEQKTVYKNVALSEIAGGRIASYSIDSGGYDIKMQLPDSDGAMKDKHMVVSTGAIAGQVIDIAYLARLYTEKAGPEDKEAKPLYGPLSVKTVSFSDGDGHFSYDEIRSDGFTARMPSEPLLDTLKALTATQNPDELSPQARQALFAKAISILDMIGKSNMQLIGMKVDAPDEKEGAAGKRVKVAIDRIDMQMDSRKLDFGLNGMSIGDGDGKIEVAEASLNGFDWSSTIKGISEIIALDETQIETFQFNRLIPELGRVRVGGINVDIAAPEKPEEETTGTPERIKFSLKNFEMGLTKPFNGIPTDIEIKQDELTLPIPADSEEEVFVEARKLGLETLAFSYGLAAGWDEPNSNLVIRDISLSSKDFGSVNFAGLVSGFTEEFFSFDVNRAQAALFGLAGREVKLTIKDEGLMAKAIKLYALQNDMTEDQVRATLTLVAGMMLPQVAAEQPKLQNAVEALVQFISKPGTLTVTVKSTGANGLGIFDLVSASDNPMGLLDKVDIQATAE